MESEMKKALLILMTICFSISMVFAAETKSVEGYIADLDPAKDEKVIVEAADYLGKEEKKDAIPALVKLTQDSRVAVRLHSVMALGYIGKEDAVESINTRMLSDESVDVRYAAVLASIRIGSKKSIDAWKQAREKETDPFIKDFLEKMEQKAREK
jgi:HEAT repeat protein